MAMATKYHRRTRESSLAERPLVDIFGMPWPGYLSADLCILCGQPLSEDIHDGHPDAGCPALGMQAIARLLGGIPVGDGSQIRPVRPGEFARARPILNVSEERMPEYYEKWKQRGYRRNRKVRAHRAPATPAPTTTEEQDG